MAEPTIATARFAELTELAASVERDPAHVASEVTGLADRYRSNADHAGVSRALAILGRARRLLGEIDLAASALHAAVAAAQQVGDTEAEADAHLALAGVLALGSTMAAAFAHLDENCQAFLRLGHDASLPLVSRAEVLLSAGLSADALELADEALRRLGAEGDRATAAEAWLLRAQAARLDGDAAGAAEAAEQARATFAEMGSMGRRLAAELEVMQARRAIDARQLGMSELLRLEALAGELSAVGNASGQVAALSLATAVAADLRQIDVARRCAAAAAARAQQVGMLETRLHARYASAMAAWAVGDGATARRYLKAAFDGLARDRMTLGASDARAAIEVHARDVVDLAMRVALDDPRPWNLLTWMERARAGTALPRPAVPAVPSVVVDELAELRSVALELTRAELDGSPSDELRYRQAGLERSLHDRWLRESGPDEAVPSTRMRLGELRERLGGRGLVSVAGVGGELVAVVIGQSSRLLTVHVIG